MDKRGLETINNVAHELKGHTDPYPRGFGDSDRTRYVGIKIDSIRVVDVLNSLGRHGLMHTPEASSLEQPSLLLLTSFNTGVGEQVNLLFEDVNEDLESALVRVR